MREITDGLAELVEEEIAKYHRGERVQCLVPAGVSIHDWQVMMNQRVRVEVEEGRLCPGCYASRIACPCECSVWTCSTCGISFMRPVPSNVHLGEWNTTEYGCRHRRGELVVSPEMAKVWEEMEMSFIMSITMNGVDEEIEE